MADTRQIDPERLAALIDGRLSAPDAAAVRAELAHADAATLAAYADAVAIAGELRGSDGIAPVGEVRPIASARSAAARSASRRWLMPAAGVIAAGFVAAMVFGPLGGRSDEIPDYASGLPAGSLEIPAWGTTRSGDAAMSARGRAVRLGVLLMQYQLAAQRGEGDATAGDRAARIAVLLDGVAGGSGAAVRWREIAGGKRVVPAVEAVLARAFVDPAFEQLGEWLEGARSAAATNSVAWFDTHPPAPVVRRLTATAIPVAEERILREVQRAVEARPLDLARIGAVSEAALVALGR